MKVECSSNIKRKRYETKKRTHYFRAISMSAFQLYRSRQAEIELKKALAITPLKMPLSRFNLLWRPLWEQYEMRGPIMKYKNRNKHSFPRLWAVEYSLLFPLSRFALTSVLYSTFNSFFFCERNFVLDAAKELLLVESCFDI